MKDKEPVLCAFPVDGKDGFYNVWRYDTPSTQNILFMYKDESREEAVGAALKKIAGEQKADKCEPLV